MTQVQDLQDQIAALESSVGQTAGVVAAFDGELSKMRNSLVYTGREVNQLASGISSGLRRAFDDVVFDGVKLQDALRGVAQSIARTAYDIAMRPVQNAVGGAIANGINGLLGGLMPFEKGGALASGRVTAFAKGGVVSAPTSFAMRGGMGLMGEAGPEAVMPLARGSDGRLGVQAQGASARPVTVVMNIQTPDVAGFQRSQSQIAATAQRMLARGQKNR
ncbi:MAG: phage tail tape measure protein [Cypionkella sp.]|nr:phage tail tape measure protein [Cypionkella sp.]